MKQFKLMTSLYAHTGDVKSLCPTRDPGDFVSVSRDLNAKLWHCQNSETSNQYIQSQTITTHKKYVNAVVVVYSLVEYPNGLIITGSNDQTISIHDIESNTNIAQLKEHDGAVCTLYFDNSSQRNLLYSGSFDSSAKVWNLNDLVKSDFKLTSIFTIKEHSHTVWSVMAIEKRQILLTGSADKTIKQFRIDPVNRTYDFQFKYAGHSDCVRGLCVNTRNDNEFFSCSNDGSVIQWRLDSPTPLRQIPVTGSFLYSINALRFQEDDGKGSCHVITSGEDRSLRIHKIGPNSIDMLQCLVMPCQTLWYAVELGNGNLAVACSDGTIRLFTQKDQLMASKGEVESFEKELSNFAISIKTDEKLAEIKLNDLPGVEALEIPGKRDGQSIVVNNNNEAEVYQWDAEGMRWVKIGVAVGSSQTGGGSRSKVSYLGKEYDYVFDIELDDTKASLKLPYNVSEDPYHAAQKFIHKHELSQMFLDQIAQFIINNTQSETIGDSKAGKTYYDPFTGENRYVPPAGNSGSTNGSQSTYSDPFTGSGAYKTSYENINQSEVSKPSRKNEYFPHLDFILFDQINSEAILRKAKEFQQKSNQTTGDLAKFEFLVNNLDKVKSEADFASEIQSLFEMINTWPKEFKFPLIDLIRISVLNRKVADHILESPSFVKTLFSQINADSPINSMLVAKVLCNMFKGFIDSKVSDPKLALFLLTERHNIIKSLHELSTTENKSFQIAFSTLLLNYVVLIKQLANSKTSLDLNASNLNEIMIEFVQYFSELSNLVLNWDPEATFRILVAFGTIVSKTDSLLDYELIVTLAKSLEGFKITCQDINAKPGNFAPKISSTAAFLLKELN